MTPASLSGPRRRPCCMASLVVPSHPFPDSFTLPFRSCLLSCASYHKSGQVLTPYKPYPNPPMLSLWGLVKVGVMLTNAITILNRKRFLSKFEGDRSLSKVVDFLLAVQYMRVPLIPLNATVIVVELLFGG